MKKKKTQKLETALHLLTVLVLLLKAFDLYRRDQYIPATIISVLAATALIIITFRRRLGMRSRKAGITCFYLEAPALMAVALVLHREGNEFLPLMFFIAAVIYPVAGFIASKKFKQIKNLY
ncbi:hypothetical protein [Flavobacterium cyanobacteriorum]|uniref:hypothetical protein n=1 Tax=Flavobacterium cyanobacteriorum TaxID=2022802 RepID=UPI00101AE1F2|nr:hypothetical protein [Flavobacterium cyanobacteriorum]